MAGQLRISRSPEETIEIGKSIGAALEGNTIVCLEGDLGAGKTTLIKGIAAGYAGVSEEEVSSPTFVYLNIYQGKRVVYHFDLYRLENGSQFLQMGFEDFFQCGGVCLVEWPSRIAALLPQKVTSIHISDKGQGTREIRITTF